MAWVTSKVYAHYNCRAFVDDKLVCDKSSNIFGCLSIEIESKFKKKYVLLGRLLIVFLERRESFANALKTFMGVGRKRKNY